MLFLKESGSARIQSERVRARAREGECIKIGPAEALHTSGTWQQMTTFGPFGDRSILPVHSIGALSSVPLF